MPTNFADDAELNRFAKTFVETRVNSLEKDVRHCMEIPYAPFPAIAYCFATIDLLGALVLGNAKKMHSGPTKRAKDYMERFMLYPKEARDLLMDIFRHKIVHLAQPNPVCEYQTKHVTWKYHHDNLGCHLKLTDIDSPKEYPITTTIKLKPVQLFEISLVHFAKDIRDSAFEPGGYLHTLRTDATLRK